MRRGAHLLREMKQLEFQFQKDKKYHNVMITRKLLPYLFLLGNVYSHRPPKIVVNSFTCIIANHPLPILFLLGLFTRMYSHHPTSPSIYSHHRKFFGSVDTFSLKGNSYVKVITFPPVNIYCKYM